MQDTPVTFATPTSAWRAVVEATFYGHLFYGVCAVAQIIETSVQLALPFNGWLMAVAFLGTTVFYTYPYTRDSANRQDPRVAWHHRHRTRIQKIQRWAMLALTVVLIGMATTAALPRAGVFEWVVLLVVPGAAALYYNAPLTSRTTPLRQRGWLKPFVIGFVWAGTVVAYPIVFARLQDGHEAPLSLFACMLFVKTLMFVAVLAILFDVKDRDVDHRLGLSTVVTLVGPERALFHVSLPLTLLGIATYLSYATVQHLTAPRVVLVLAPFALLIMGIASLRRPRSILYYLVVIDGLMLAKALLDILAMQF